MFYDFFSEQYKNGQATKVGFLNVSRYNREICRVMYALQKPQATVLEIGPGLGRFAEECAAMHYSYVGVEFNQEILYKLSVTYRMIRSFVPPLPIKNRCIDIIVADQVIEHMPTFREALSLLSECSRILKPSGFLVLGFPDYARMTGLAFYDWDYSHSFLTTVNRVDQILKDVGFKPLKVVRFTGSVSNPLLRLLLDFAMIGINARVTRLIGDALHVRGFLYKIRKTLGASTVIFAQKV